MLTHSVPQDTIGYDCAVVRREAFAACDGELSPDQLVAMERHLAACDECRALFAADVTLHRVVRDALHIESAPPGLRERIERILHAHATENAPA
jgi:mycothiol system anti-sigma-R factor